MAKDEKGGGGSGGNPSGALINSSAVLDTSNQLQSINEEGEAQDGQQMPTAANLARNTPGRQSKEFTAKLHKVSFPNFKKLKDKESKSSKSTGGGMPMAEMGGKQQDSQSSSMSMAPLKRASILKDKLINRNSSVPSDSIEGVEKVSIKMKNLSLDSGNSSAAGSGVLVLGGNSSGANSNNSFDLTESSSDPLENNSIATRPSILPLDLDKGHSNGSGGGGGVSSAHNNNNNNKSNVQVYQL